MRDVITCWMEYGVLRLVFRHGDTIVDIYECEESPRNMKAWIVNWVKGGKLPDGRGYEA